MAVHQTPCAWFRALMWVCGILITLALFAAKAIDQRIDRVEIRTETALEKAQQASDTLIRQQADLEYIKATVTEIRQDLKTK